MSRYFLVSGTLVHDCVPEYFLLKKGPASDDHLKWLFSANEVLDWLEAKRKDPTLELAVGDIVVVLDANGHGYVYTLLANLLAEMGREAPLRIWP